MIFTGLAGRYGLSPPGVFCQLTFTGRVLRLGGTGGYQLQDGGGLPAKPVEAVRHGAVGDFSWRIAKVQTLGRSRQGGEIPEQEQKKTNERKKRKGRGKVEWDFHSGE